VLLGTLIKPKSSAKLNWLVKYASILLMYVPLTAHSQEVDVRSTLNTTGYVYETKIGDVEATQAEAYTIRPSLFGSYSSRLVSASLSADHFRVRQNVDSEDETDDTNRNYTNLRYNSTLTLIENALTFTLNGAQNYRVVNQQQAGFSDEILGSGNLTKSRSNSAQLNFSIPNPLYFGFNLQSSYSKTQTDRSQETQTGVDGDNVGVSVRLYQGKRIRPINFDISAQYNDTSRANFENFESTRVQATFGLPIMKKVDLVVTGSLDEYGIDQTGFIGRPNLDTTSYGAGFKWSPSNGRNIALTYNQLEEGENQTDFVGVNLAWAFSARTALNLDYGKRFYGDAYRLDFTHSLKSLRTSVSYSEDVTTFSRLGASSINTNGIFVCEFGSTELIDCFQPNSLDYQLQAGEEFRASTEIDTDISEEVILRKSGTASIGYQKRKVTMSVDATYRRTEYLESDRISINRSLRLNVNYAMGRKTNISLVSSIATNQFTASETADTTLATTINFRRSLSRYLNLNIATRLLDRESDNLARNGTDKRLTVGLIYTF
jgi:uncharacterized protein (PEP-CTERM system associated)